jgi:DNA-binding NarL/FixJ family response regulator
MDKINVILVDDHQIVRDGIKALLSEDPAIFIAGEADNAVELKALLEAGILPDVIILDISLPGESGIDITRRLTAEYQQVHVLILSMYTDEEFILNAIQAGAKGYLPKNTGRRELVQAVQNLARGEEYFSEAISRILLKSLVRKTRTDQEQAGKTVVNLTKRELEILRLFAAGQSNQDIAEKLFISVRTVESHKTHIMQKLDLKSTVDLIKFAIREGITEL